MLLLIDAGNTLIKWALVKVGSPSSFEHPSWLDSGEIPHNEVENILKICRNLPSTSVIKRIIISNVAGQAFHEHLLSLINTLCPEPPTVECFASSPYLAGVTNRYSEFSQLGSDRFASLIGARTLFPNKNLVIATCGTATTIDTLTADGIFIGGMILPGLRLMAASLVKNTALLPDIGQMTEDIPAFATDTITAIRNGCMTAQAGAIEHAVTIHGRQLNDVKCVLSGGAAKLILPYLSIPAQIVDNLVLVGLHAADVEKYG